VLLKCNKTGLLFEQGSDSNKRVYMAKKSLKDPLRNTVTAFRRGLLGRRPSRLMCFVVCAPLEALLTLEGHAVKMSHGWILDEEGDEIAHTWLRLSDGRIIDPTADQFKKPDGGKMPRVYIGEKPEWYIEN
jgi:hypothetical protein